MNKVSYISKEVRDRLEGDLQLRQKVGIAGGVGERSVKMWAEADDIKLTTDPVLSVLEKELKLNRKQILTKEKA